ncbi:hypothetical protein BDC45DRAFT_438578 [Circinella umbellata]|nr:hypothetical protein BDC45DRAFT_438578 [Circinella umbellata]
MARKERSRCLRWRLGWLPGGKPKPCKTCGFPNFHKNHAIHCLHIHNRLQIEYNKTADPISYLFSLLPNQYRKRKLNFGRIYGPRCA